VPGRQRREQRETKTAGAESGFPSVPVGTSERDKEKQVILVLRFVATSTRDIYTKDWNRQSGIQEQDLSTLSKVQ